MRIIKNDILPIGRFVAINLLGVIFVRGDRWDAMNSIAQDALLQHEAVHTEQMRELCYVGFYVLYFLEWIWRLVFHAKTAYRGISFEIEARDHEFDFGYLYSRKRFAQWRRS